MNYQEKIKLVRNPNTPAEVLVEFSMDKDHLVRCWIAKHPNTPAEILINLSTDERASVRREVAWNPNTPPEALINLSMDEDYCVCYRVARHPNTPEYIKNYLKAKTYCGRFKTDNVYNPTLFLKI